MRMEFLAAGLLILAGLVWLLGLWLRKRAGLPEGELLYSDSDYWQKVPKPLYDSDLELVGKPDYLLRKNGGSLVPVELKSANAPEKPWDSNIIQLAAYCYLVENNFGVRPTHGLIQYKDKSFKIPYTEELEARLIDIIAEMRQVERVCAAGYTPHRSHNNKARCGGCGYAGICDQKL